MRYLICVLGLSIVTFALPVGAAELEAGGKCELSKNVRVSAKAKGKGKKTKLKKGAVLEIVDLGKAWSEVKSDEVTGFVRTKQLNKRCVAMEAEATEPPAAEPEAEADAAEEPAAEGETAAAEPVAEAAEGEAAAADAGAPAAEETAAPVEEGAALEAGAEAPTEGGDAAADTGAAEAGEPAEAPAEADAAADAAPATETAEPESQPAAEAPASGGPDDMLEFGFGLVIPYGIGDVSGFGVGGLLEFRYNITSNFAAGFRVEGDVMFSGSVSGQSADVGLSVLSAYMLKGEAQLSDSGFSPMAGLAVGLYNFAGVSADSGGGGLEAGRLFGLAPQLGLDMGGFRIAAMYHLLFGKTEVSVGTAEVSRNFLGIELSGQIGFL